MTYGPIDFIALEFKGNQFKGEIMPALFDLVNNGTIRVLDLFIIQKDAQGNVTMREAAAGGRSHHKNIRSAQNRNHRHDQKRRPGHGG